MSSFFPVIIQSICTSWTKASRGGGINAYARNRTPETFEIPALTVSSSENEVFLHEVFYGERDSFQHPKESLKQIERTDPFWYDCFRFSLHEKTLRVTFEWERSNGVPRRLDILRTEYTLQEHQWMRIIYNLRIVRDYGWTYKKHIFNIGFFLPSSSKIFLEGEPTYTYTGIARLW